MGQVIEADDTGRLVLPAELLGEAKPRARYRVEPHGANLIVQPEVPEVQEPIGVGPDLTAEEWWSAWLVFSNAITQNSTSDQSAVELLSEMRR